MRIPRLVAYERFCRRIHRFSEKECQTVCPHDYCRQICRACIFTKQEGCMGIIDRRIFGANTRNQVNVSYCFWLDTSGSLAYVFVQTETERFLFTQLQNNKTMAISLPEKIRLYRLVQKYALSMLFEPTFMIEKRHEP